MIRGYKWVMVNNIVSALKKQGKTELLEIIAKGVQKKEKHIGKRHQIFKPSFGARLYKEWWVFEVDLSPVP